MRSLKLAIDTHFYTTDIDATCPFLLEALCHCLEVKEEHRSLEDVHYWL